MYVIPNAFIDRKLAPPEEFDDWLVLAHAIAEILDAHAAGSTAWEALRERWYVFLRQQPRVEDA